MKISKTIPMTQDDGKTRVEQYEEKGGRKQ